MHRKWKKWELIINLRSMVSAVFFFLMAGTSMADTSPVTFNFSLDMGSRNPFYQFNISFPDEFRGLTSSFGYCAEYTQGISMGSYLAETRELEGNYLKAAWLLENYASEGTTDDKTITALQAAIWNVLGYSGAEKPNLIRDGYLTSDLYLTMLSEVGKVSDFASLGLEDKYEILVPYYKIGGLEESYQDLIIKAPNATPTPIPAAFWIFGTGVVGLLGLRKKSAKA